MHSKNLTGNYNRELIDTSEYYEIEYWSKRFGVSIERLKTAVKAVGNMVAAVEQFLKK